jgi:hypothetical protein
MVCCLYNYLADDTEDLQQQMCEHWTEALITWVGGGRGTGADWGAGSLTPTLSLLLHMQPLYGANQSLRLQLLKIHSQYIKYV